MASDSVVLVASRKYFVTGIAIALCVAFVLLLVDLLWAGGAPVTHILMLLALLLGAVVIASGIGPLISPPRLQIDKRGMTVSKHGALVHFPWSQIAEVRIVETPPAEHKGWLVLWQAGSASPPPEYIYLTEWRSDLNGVRLIDLLYLGVSPEVIADAVRTHGGDRWNDSRTPR